MRKYKINIPGLQFLDANGQRITGDEVELDKELGERFTLKGIVLPTEGVDQEPIETASPPTPPPVPANAPGITALGPDEAISLAQKQSSLEVLQAMLAAETANKNRKTVKNAIAVQIEELQ